MSGIAFGRVATLVNSREGARPFKLGLEAIESGTGRLLADAPSDYSGEGVAFEPGDVLFGKLRPYLAKAWLADREGAAVGDFHVYRAGERILPVYMKWLVLARNFLDPVVSSVSGVKMPRASWDFVRSVEVHVPSLSEQHAIADYLDRETVRIDTLIEEQQRLVEMLRERRNAMLDWVLVQSGDTTIPLRHASVLITVGIVVQPAQWYVDSGTIALRGTNVKPERIVLDDVVRLSDEGHAAHQKSQLQAGDVVVVRTGQAGAASAVPDELQGLNAIDLLIVRPDRSLDGEFLAMILNAPTTRRRLSYETVGSIQGHLNVSALRSLVIPLPRIEQQRSLVAGWRAEASKIDALIAEAERFIELSRERRAALITAAVTGQIDVREGAA